MSQELLTGMEKAPQRALFKASGFTDGELGNPLIAVVTAQSELSPEYANLSEITDAVKAGVYSGGCTPVVVPAIGLGAALALGGSGRYVLPSRELVADGVESVLSLDAFDGAVFIAGGDATIAGMLMGAVRSNIPSIFVTSGPMESGLHKGSKVGLTAVLEGMGKLKSGSMNIDDMTALETDACPSLGSARGDMGCVLEALGMALERNGTAPAMSSARIKLAKATGLTACELVRNADAPKKILTKRAFTNAFVFTLAYGAAPDAILHLIAAASECNIPFDFDGIQALSDGTPVLTKLVPHENHDLIDFGNAGGVMAVLHELAKRKLVDGSLRTVAGVSLASQYDRAHVLNTDVISKIDSPASAVAGLTFLKGNLAENGSIAFRRLPNGASAVFNGKAKCFDREEEAVEAIYSGRIKKGDAVVIRCEGPSSGPGMREMLHAASALTGNGLENDVALITDGRLCAYRGLAVGYVCPEAIYDSKLALVKDGDTIKIDISGGRITLDVPAKELQARQKKQHIRDTNATGWLLRYQNLVMPATTGAVLKKKF